MRAPDGADVKVESAGEQLWVGITPAGSFSDPQAKLIYIEVGGKSATLLTSQQALALAMELIELTKRDDMDPVRVSENLARRFYERGETNE